MFVLGFHFPASEGNKIADEKVLAKLEEAVSGSLSKVASVKIYAGNNEYKTISNVSTVLGKALVQYFEVENEEKEAKYLTFTNKYQIAALVKNQDKDAEAIEIADFFDKSRDQITLEVSYKYQNSAANAASFGAVVANAVKMGFAQLGV